VSDFRGDGVETLIEVFNIDDPVVTIVSMEVTEEYFGRR